MYKSGDYVVHNGHGVCLIIEKIHNENLNKDFYKLETIHNKMSIMMPMDKVEDFLRPILTKVEMTEALNNSFLVSSEYIKDNKERKIHFQNLVLSKDINDTIKLLKELYHLAEEKKKEKKSLGSFDSQFLQQAERKLFNEIAITMDITSMEARTYFYSHFEVKQLV